MTLVREVEAIGPLRSGLEGRLALLGGVRVRFEVLEVNEDGPSWTRLLRLGRLSVEVEHHVDEGFGLVAIEARGPVAFAYVPFARRSLSRLLRRGGQSPPRA
jgi:hypothetical protein